MLSRLQPAFILIPRVETSQGGSSPLRVLLYRSTSGGFRLSPRFPILYTHTRARDARTRAHTPVSERPLAPLTSPRHFARLASSSLSSPPRPHHLPRPSVPSLPLSHSIFISPSLLLPFDSTVRIRCPPLHRLFPLLPRSRIQARVFSGLTCFLRVHTSKQLPKQ